MRRSGPVTDFWHMGPRSGGKSKSQYKRLIRLIHCRLLRKNHFLPENPQSQGSVAARCHRPGDIVSACGKKNLAVGWRPHVFTAAGGRIHPHFPPRACSAVTWLLERRGLSLCSRGALTRASQPCDSRAMPSPPAPRARRHERLPWRSTPALVLGRARVGMRQSPSATKPKSREPQSLSSRPSSTLLP